MTGTKSIAEAGKVTSGLYRHIFEFWSDSVPQVPHGTESVILREEKEKNR